MNMNLNIGDFLEVVNYPKFSTIKLIGFVDAGIVENIKPVINDKLVSSCNNVIINFESTEFLDSHGIGFLVSLLKKVHTKKGQMFFAGAHDQPEAVLKMVGFNNNLVTYCSNIQEASALINQKAMNS